VFVCRRQLDGWLFLVSASLAVSALFVLFTQLAWTPVAERYMYIPCGPFVIGLVYVVSARLTLPVWPRVAIVLVSLLLGAGAWLTATRNIVWQDNLTLYQDAVRQSPDFAPAKNQLALALKAHNRFDEANEILASNKMPGGDAASLNIAVALWEQGDYFAARSYLLQLLADNFGVRETQILEMLVRVTSEYLDGINDETLKRKGYKDTLVWLERLTEISSTGFNYYRIGRIQLALEDGVAAQHAFAEAARRFPPDSIYKEPATKLARDLAQ
jgi:tetratricopeptide (TPR) repeat protein